MPFPHLDTYTPFEDNVTDVLAEDQIHNVLFGGMQVTSLPVAVSFVASAGTIGQTIVSSGATFISSGVVPGHTIYNSKDGSYAIVKRVDSETSLVTTPLNGGSNNLWNPGDSGEAKTCPNQMITLIAQDGVNAPGIYVRNTGNTAWVYLVPSHNTLTGRDATDCHPTSSITGLDGIISGLDLGVASKASKYTTLTINGVTQDISEDRSWTIATGGGRRLMWVVGGVIGNTGTNVANTWVLDGNYTISKCNMWLDGVGNGTLTADIKKNGTSIFATTKPSITGTSQTSINTGTLTTTTLASGDILTLDIVAVQATTKGSGLYVEIVIS